MERRQRPRRWTALLAACLLAPVVAKATPQFEVEAAYLAKFAPFVVWPQTVFPTPKSPFVICVQGDDPFGAQLDQLTAGQSVGAHPVIVRRLPRVASDSGCQIAYLGGSPVQSQGDALRAVEGQPVLTVTDAGAAGDDSGKGMVRFVLINGRVRFLIDAGKAGQSGLAISSKLLALAADVAR